MKDFTNTQLSPAMAFMAGAIKEEEDTIKETPKKPASKKPAQKKPAPKKPVQKKPVEKVKKTVEPVKKEAIPEEPKLVFKEAKLYRDQRVTFYLTQDIYDAMDKTCKEKGISRNEFANVVFESYLKLKKS